MSPRCRTALAARAPARNIVKPGSSASTACSMNFTATSRLRNSCQPSQTTPIPPRPSSRCIFTGPSCRGTVICFGGGCSPGDEPSLSGSTGIALIVIVSLVCIGFAAASIDSTVCLRIMARVTMAIEPMASNDRSRARNCGEASPLRQRCAASIRGTSISRRSSCPRESARRCMRWRRSAR